MNVRSVFIFVFFLRNYNFPLLQISFCKTHRSVLYLGFSICRYRINQKNFDKNTSIISQKKVSKLAVRGRKSPCFMRKVCSSLQARTQTQNCSKMEWVISKFWQFQFFDTPTGFTTMSNKHSPCWNRNEVVPWLLTSGWFSILIHWKLKKWQIVLPSDTSNWYWGTPTFAL